MPGGLTFANAGEWEVWLAAYHNQPGGVWLKVRKKSSAKRSITLSEAADVALCYGWIDSVRRSFDDDYFSQRYSRRQPKGSWSKVNVERVEALIAAGRMQPPGIEEVNAAKADGRWEAAYESQKTAAVPPDLQAALKGNKRARESFDQLGKTERYLVVLPLLKARTPEIRAARLQRAIDRMTS